MITAAMRVQPPAIRVPRMSASASVPIDLSSSIPVRRGKVFRLGFTEPKCSFRVWRQGVSLGERVDYPAQGFREADPQLGGVEVDDREVFGAKGDVPADAPNADG